MTVYPVALHCNCAHIHCCWELPVHDSNPCRTKGGVFAQCGYSANYHLVYPGNTPENHPPTAAGMINSKQHGVQNSGLWDRWQASDQKKNPCCTSRGCTPPPPCISYTNVPNHYGPYAHCSLDKGIACAQHILLAHTCACAWYECTLTSAHISKCMQTQESLGNMKISGSHPCWHKQ